MLEPTNHRIINIFGILAFVLAIVAYRLSTLSFVSVWCFFVAVLSFIVYLYFFKSGASRAAERIGFVVR